MIMNEVETDKVFTSKEKGTNQVQSVDEIINNKRPGDINQSVMDMGRYISLLIFIGLGFWGCEDKTARM